MDKVILSYNRAGKVTTGRILLNAFVCVPESQAEEYRKFHSKVIVHPDSLIGGSPKRQWIYERFGDVFMVDDDVLSFSRLYVKEKPYKLEPDEVDGLIDDTYEICKQAGIKLFGFNSLKRPLMFHGGRPIRLTGFITGGAYGILKDPNLYFPDIPDYYGEDCFISALNGHFNRFCWIDDRFTTTFRQAGSGGTSTYRNDEARKRTLLHLKEKFGDSIVQDKFTNPRVGKYEKKFKSPY